MANMPYCRFENTLQDLQDCDAHLEDEVTELSPHEARARKALIRLAISIALEYGEEVDRPCTRI